jgi:hypothetical protein
MLRTYFSLGQCQGAAGSEIGSGVSVSATAYDGVMRAAEGVPPAYVGP